MDNPCCSCLFVCLFVYVNVTNSSIMLQFSWEESCDLVARKGQSIPCGDIPKLWLLLQFCRYRLPSDHNSQKTTGLRSGRHCTRDDVTSPLFLFWQFVSIFTDCQSTKKAFWTGLISTELRYCTFLLVYLSHTGLRLCCLAWSSVTNRNPDRSELTSYPTG